MRTRSFLVGAASGALLAQGSVGTRIAFGSDPGVAFPLLAVVWTSAVFGWRTATRVPALSPRLSFFLLAAVAALISLFAFPAGRVVAALGGGAGAGPVPLWIARALTAAPVLVPVGWLLGRLLRVGVDAAPSSAQRAGVAAAGVAGAWVGCLAAMLLMLFPHGPSLVAAAAVLALLACAVFAVPRTDAREIPEEEVEQEQTALLRGPALPALSAGFAFATLPLLAPRLLSFAAGHHLAGIPVVPIAFVSACALGALIAVVAVSSRSRSRAPRTAAAALLGASLLVVGLWTRYDDLPPRFAEWIAVRSSLEALVANAFRSVGFAIGSVGTLLGFALAFLARDLPASRDQRSRWVAVAVVCASFGFVAGRLLLSGQLPNARLESAFRTVALITGFIAAAGIPWGGRGVWARAFGAFAGLLLLVLLARSAPPSDRKVLLAERDMIPASALVPIAQKSWLEFDEDGSSASYAVVRRGHSRRLLVDGRFEVSNETIKTQGFLAHLPILLHPEPRRVLVLGSGSGIVLDAALAHPIERVECFETDRVPVRATAQMGFETERALRDPRLAIRLGDFGDLLARSSPADVIVSQVSGLWGDRAASVTTLEFLKLASARLHENGLFCLWVPDASLTKDGLRILFATMARAFPQVEAWSGQGGDLLLLAKRTNAPIDASRLVERFQNCACLQSTRRAWVEEPVTFLASFLASDATIRTIAGDAAFHTRAHPRLRREEASRRRASVPVNPVPGLAKLGDDVVATISSPPGEGFDTAVRAAVQAKVLEREGHHFESEKKTFEAVDAFQRAIDRNPRDGSVRRSLAMLRTRLGIRYAADQSLAAAHNNMRAAVEADTTYAQGFANLGNLIMSLGPPEYALSTTHQALLIEPDDDLAWVQLGTIHRGIGDLDEAMANFERAMRLNPRNVSAALGWIDAKLEKEEPSPDVAGAVHFLEGYLAVEPQNEELQYRLGKYRDALRLRTESSAESPVSSAPPTP